MLGLSTESWPDPSLDTAVSKALLRRADRGEAEGFLRLFVPARAVVFGRQDRSRPGFGAAVAAARSLGYPSVVRLAGGRAAVFHEGTIAMALALEEAAPRETITERFAAVSEAIRSALSALGVDARVGEVEGEYCPGAYSVSAGGAHKLAGIGQRLTRNAAHVGGVVVVDGGDEVNRVLVPVYDALGYRLDPGVTGAVADHAATGVEATLRALVDSFSEMLGPLRPAAVDAAALDLARSLREDVDTGVP